MKTYKEAGHDKPKQNGRNLYPFVDILTVAFIILLFAIRYGSDRKAFAIMATIVGITDIVLGIIQMAWSSSRIKNDSGKDVICKPETGTEPFILPAGETAYDIDGYAANGHIYKIGDGTHVTIKENDNFSTCTIAGKTINLIDRAGKLEKAPDTGWNPLFRAAGRENDLAK